MGHKKEGTNKSMCGCFSALYTNHNLKADKNSQPENNQISLVFNVIPKFLTLTFNVIIEQIQSLQIPQRLHRLWNCAYNKQ